MRALLDSFLRARHWQLFLLFVGLCFAAAAAMLITVLLSPREALRRVFPFFVVIELLAVSFALWLWSLGVFLNSLLPLHLRMKKTLFRVSVLFVPLYLPMFGLFFQGTNQVQNVTLIPILFALIIPLHFFAMFCQIYSWYFVSRSLALAESLGPASFADYIGYFFGLWLFPIGVWIIQPRINRLYANAPTLSS